MQTKKRAKPVKFGKEVKKHSSVDELKENIKEPEIKKEAKQPEEPQESQEKVMKSEVIKEEEIQEEEELPKEVAKEEKTDTEEKPRKTENTESSDELTPDEKKAAFGSFTNADENRQKRNGNFGFFVTVFLVTFALALMGIAGFYYTSDQTREDMANSFKKLTSSELSATPTSKPTPTTQPVDLSAYTIRVLNGSETAGEAAKVKDMLTSAGFTTGSVGNADTADFTKTIIAAKKEVSKEYLDELSKTLSKNYTVETKIDTLSENSGESDVVVTIGSDTTQ